MFFVKIAKKKKTQRNGDLKKQIKQEKENNKNEKTSDWKKTSKNKA